MENFFTNETGKRLIVSGAAAAARGAYEAGAGLVLTYPGSPVVETFEILAAEGSPAAKRCSIIVNEHVAWHRALGFSLSGGRSFVIMKHVGVNVAADPMHYSAYTGVKGGMVVFVGSDPGANCSTGEFDVRFYSLHSHLPVIEPRSVQETVAAVRAAFDASERYSLPVMVVVPSALCYGVGSAVSGPVSPVRGGKAFVNSREYTCVGPLAVKRHESLMKKIELISRAEVPLEEPAFSGIFDDAGSGAQALIVASGIYYDFVREALAETGLSGAASVYSPAVTLPLNEKELAAALASRPYKKVVFVEDLEGFLELSVSARMAKNRMTAEIYGRGLLPSCGELKYQTVKDALAKILGSAGGEIPAPASYKLQPQTREGTFCPGCPHRAFFYALNKYLGPGDVIGGDIGCSSLPPHFSSWLTCMNSGASIASGAALAGGPEAGPKQRIVSLIGDSTFFHGGMQTILQCAADGSRQICFILDNGWTAMTGHQPTFTTRPPDGTAKTGDRISIKKILEAFGVKNIREADPYRVDRFMALINELTSSDTEGFSAVIVRRECRLQARKRAAAGKKSGRGGPSERFEIVNGRCAKCNECYSVLTCPAIFKDGAGELYIDQQLCDRCGVCRQICPNGAIALSEATDGY